MKQLLRFAGIFCLVFFMSACTQQNENGASQSATKFFEALYEKQDLQRALKYCAPQMAEVLEHYGTAEMVQEHLLALQFDEMKYISTAESRALLLDEHRNMVDVTVFMSGMVDGYKYIDEREVRMQRVGERWLLEKFLF